MTHLPKTPASLLRRISLVVGLSLGLWALPSTPSAWAQSVSGADPLNGAAIEAIQVVVLNPGPDVAVADRIADSVRRSLALFPGARFSKEAFDLQLARARRTPEVASLDYDVSLGVAGGVNLKVQVTLGEAASTREGRGRLAGDASAGSLLLDRNGTYLVGKFDALGLYYANNNSWYGQPGPLLAGNPLVQGQPSGAGYRDWAEGYVHYGVYGITPLSRQVHVYGGLSAITAGSSGDELFSSKTRTHTGVEDAYVGIVGGSTDAAGNRLVINVSAGRQKFSLANAFLIANTAANGHDRAALQANARWAADNLVLAQVAYNRLKLEVFHLDPDELPILDSGTRLAGANVEFRPSPDWLIAASYVAAPESRSAYYGPAGTPVGTRKGLKVYDARFSYAPAAQGAGLFGGGEFALQENDDFPMQARAGWAEIGYRLPAAPWAPSVSYRYSYFSGDDPDTSAYERWDPLFSGGNGEQWVQGANHFKVVQDSNVVAHRLQARLKPDPRIEIVPQFWVFRAAETNNIGGNPALSTLSSRDYGMEANVTGKWFVSRKVYVHGHIAYTQPGDAVKQALTTKPEGWLSLLLFVRYAY